MPPAPIESSGSIKFDDQTFLLSYFTEISQLNLKGVSPKPYENTFRLNNNTEFPMSQMIGILNGTANLSPFLKLSTHQYSALIPRVRLYRLDYDTSGTKLSDKEFIFDKDYKYEITDILKAPKRSNSGIKRINWRLAGTNPVTAEKQVEVEIELYFDSINSFSSGDFDSMRDAWTKAQGGITSNSFTEFNTFGALDTPTTTRNYWSLLFHPKIEQDDTTPRSRERYNTNFFRIRANVGWEEVETNIKNQLFPDLDINEEIKKLNYSFLLNLVEHKFNFNEDGSLTVTATYFAQFENSTHNYNFNLLGKLKEDLEAAKNLSINNLIDEIIDKEKGGSLATIAEQTNTFDVATLRYGFSELNPANIIDEIGFNLSDEEKSKLISELSQISLNDLNEISNVLNNKEVQGCLKNNLPLNAVSQNGTTAINGGSSEIANEGITTLLDRISKLIERYSNIKKDFYYKKLFDTLIDKDNIRILRVKKETKEKWDKFAQTNGKSPKPNFNETENVIISNPIEEQQTLFETFKPYQTEGASEVQPILTQAAVKFENDKKYIPYIKLGDIIESAFDVVKEQFSDFPDLINEIKRINIVCGNISNNSKILEISNPDNASPQNRNILDIPIEIKLLKLFLIENVVKPQKDVYSFFSFIKDLITKLVVGALNGSNLYNSQTQVYSNTSLATTIFSLGNANSPENPVQRLLEYIDPVDFQLQANFYYINNINTHTDYYTSLLIYDKQFIDFYPNNDPILDEQMGIYHYTIGQDYGLLKNANFSRIDTPYLKEAKAVGKKTFYLGQFRDRYNSSLTMVGNNIYYPGMMLYIQPSVEAVQSVDKYNPEANPSFSQITGMGGYYFVEKVESTISEEGYETKLDCIWQYDGSEQPDESVNDVSRCDVKFTKPQTLNLFNSLLTKAENETEKKKREQEEQSIKDIAVSAVSGLFAASGLGALGVAALAINEFFSEDGESE